MPLYHFNLADGVFDPDPDGTELSDIQAARVAAVQYAGAIMREQPNTIWADGDWRLEVTDSDQNLLFTITIIATEVPAARHPQK